MIYYKYYGKAAIVEIFVKSGTYGYNRLERFCKTVFGNNGYLTGGSTERHITRYLYIID